MKLCFEDERSNKSMNFILLSLIVAIVTTNSSTGKVPEKKVCALRDETCKKILCKGKMIVLDAKMARVASVEPYQLWLNAETFSNYGVRDEVGKKQPTFRSGTK